MSTARNAGQTPLPKGTVQRARPPYGRARKILLGVGIGLAALVIVAVIASFFVDEPLRRYMERTLNTKLQGYTAHLPGLHFQPIGFSITLKDLTITQNAHPAPPVAHFPHLHASVHWRALLHARLVADFLFRSPKVHVNLAQLRNEAADKKPLKEKGWQQALESIYPLKINRFRIRNGDVVYIDEDPKRPLHISKLNLVAENIRNIRSADRVYPSDVTVDAVVFDSGQLRLDGHANFLAEPYAGVNADVALRKVRLDYFKPILARLNVHINKGGILSTEGHVEYAPRVENVRLKQLTVQGVNLDYVHRAQTAEAEKERFHKVENAAEQLKNAPEAVIHVNELHIADSTVGYVDQSFDPGYRVFLANSDLTAKGISNQAQDEPASIDLRGQFMGEGNSTVRATFQGKQNVNLDVAVAIDPTSLPSLNGVLRRVGNFDAAAGEFSFYSELSIKNGAVNGYVKPLFRDARIYSLPQDAGKPVFNQMYEGLVDAIRTVLQNRHGDVGTKVDVSGDASKPQTDTWEIIFGLLKNAFIKAIQPGLETGK